MDNGSAGPQSEPATQGSARRQPGRLDSWKDIAAHLKRGVRTVIRWEQEEGLPVHRQSLSIPRF